MLKLEGKSLSIEVPMTVVKSIGSKHLIPSINDYAMKFINNLRDRVDFTEYDNGMLEELGPYLSNYLFMPTILEKMIVNNLTFSQAIEASEDEMKEAGAQMGAMMLLLRITGVTEMIDQLLNELIDKIIEAMKNGDFPISEETKKNPAISISLKNIPQATLYTLDNYGLYKIAEQAAQNPEIRNALQSKMVDPMIESVLKVSEEEDRLMSSLNSEERKELQDVVTECREDSAIIFPLQTIISKVLAKAIADNITFSQAAETFDPETLMKEITKKIQNSPDLMKYQSALEDIVKHIL